MSDDVERATSAIEQLVELHRLTLPQADGSANLRQLLVAYGWWTRIVHSAQAIMAVHSAGVAHEAAPLVRALIHHAVALKWVADFPDEATEAITWEHGLQGDRTVRKAIDRGWDIDPGAGPQRPVDGEPEGYKYLRSMEKLCGRADMAQAFVPLLIESKFAHPTGISADAYLSGDWPNVVLVQHPDVYTPLGASALFAAEATIQFGKIAGLPAVIEGATALRDEMIEVVQQSETTT